MNIYSRKTHLGNIGMLDRNILQAYDLNLNPIVCDLSLHLIYDILKNRNFKYIKPNPFPSTKRDIALQVSRDVLAGDLLKLIKKEGSANLINTSLFDIYQSVDVGDNNKLIGDNNSKQIGDTNGKQIGDFFRFE